MYAGPYFQNLIFCIFRAVVTNKQETAPKFNSQWYCYKLHLPSVTILSTEQYSKIYAALSCGLSIVNSTIYRVSHELMSLLQESVPYVKIYRYNPKQVQS